MNNQKSPPPGSGTGDLDDPTGVALASAQRLADRATAAHRRLRQLDDYAVVTTLIRDYFRSLVKPSQTRHMIDVGAARGALAKAFLSDGWSVDVFEPDPACQPALEQLAAAYPKLCRVYPFAVGNVNREDAVFQLNAVTGLSGLAASPFGTAKGRIPVRCVRLGDFLATTHVARLDFLKVDTEGTDFDVLDAHDYERFPPTLIFAEYSYYFKNQSPEWLRTVLETMATRGFQPVIFEYDDDGQFRCGKWIYRLVGIHFGTARVPIRANSFGNVLLYRRGDAQLVKALTKLIETC